MTKIVNDKYYTPRDLAEYCVNKTKEIIGEENISEWLEPSGGNGVFLDFLPQGTYSCDIEPEDDRIEKQNYLELDLEYKKGRLIIGNPPFGRANSSAKKFFKKSIQISDYIAFILPISQLDNNNELYQFDLIYSEDIGKQLYTDRELHCCFNIYKKPKNAKQKPDNKMKDIEFIGWRKANISDSDFKIICYGSRTGDVVYSDEVYANSLGVKIKNSSLKDKITKSLTSGEIKGKFQNISTPNLLQWQIVKYLKEQIPELK